MAIRRKPVVLVIDDDPEIVDLISSAINGPKFQVVVSFSMEDALWQFEHSNYDLIISDIYMVGMGGIEGIQKIKHLQPNSKIIAISGGYASMSPEQTLHAAKKIGADIVLPKPFRLDELDLAIESLLPT